ncbi:hypothetical protein OG439_27370 [Amycolatopsis sp. NBC_01307]|uniref:hypothetical protein n=1 Tax=Amycolatopsis sp. NBC_01307 TaxID=2903561 RepID=UPI002E167C85|nr:hypothetical protein OG439_27370 [Amycolatopsis sp. NBC_01307]
MSDQGKAYAAFIEAELKAERERRVVYDGRAQAIVTTSAGLVTLLSTVAALARKSSSFVLPTLALWPLLAALVALVCAAAFGILANWNFRYGAPASATLDRMIRDHWKDHEVDARNAVAAAQVLSLRTLRLANSRKASLATVGLIAQLLAVLLLGLAVALTVAL